MQDLFEPAFENSRHAEEECDDAKQALIRQFNIRDQDIIELKNGSLQKCISTYADLTAKLKENKSQRVLIFHILAGHGSLKDKNQSLILNRYDQKTSFYERFEAEKAVKQIAIQCPNTYSIAVFGNSREPERHTYDFYSHEMAN